jgi:chromosome segregation ATPase
LAAEPESGRNQQASAGVTLPCPNRNRTAALEEELSGTRTRRELTLAQIKQLARQIETLAEARQKLVEQIAVSLKMSRRKAIDVEATLREREKLLSDGEQNLAALERALAEKRSRLEILCQLNEEGEGLAEGSRAVMKGIGEFSRFREAITGSLVAQLDVDSKFILAIEAALGRNLHALVLTDADAACEIIAQLKKQSSVRLPWLSRSQPTCAAVEAKSSAH